MSGDKQTNCDDPEDEAVGPSSAPRFFMGEVTLDVRDIAAIISSTVLATIGKYRDGKVTPAMSEAEAMRKIEGDLAAKIADPSWLPAYSARACIDSYLACNEARAVWEAFVERSFR